MPIRTSYTQGTPCFVDLQTNDQAAAKQFYSELFGWTYDDSPGPHGFPYSMATIGGHTVAAIAQQAPEHAAAGIPPLWNTYISVDDIDAATAATPAAGGHVGMEPFDVAGAGRMAFVVDPSGAYVALWQAGGHGGAQLVNEPGTFIWSELVTDNSAAALPFYESVLGVTSESVPMGPDYSYTMLSVGDQQVGGCTAPMTPGVPNHWNVWFAVASVDETASKTKALGGTVLVAPTDMPVGRMAVIADPQGAVVSLMQPSPLPES